MNGAEPRLGQADPEQSAAAAIAARAASAAGAPPRPATAISCQASSPRGRGQTLQRQAIRHGIGPGR